MPSEPVAKIYFSDAEDVRWRRDFKGELSEQKGGQQQPSLSEDEGMRQLGDPSNTFNPLWTARAFLNVVQRQEPAPTVAELAPLLADNTPGWADMDDLDLQAWGKEIANFGMAAHAWYPAPQVAYVRLVHEEDQENTAPAAGYIEVRVQIITLVFYAGVGWRVFSFGPGATEPDWIEFPPEAIADDPRSSISMDESGSTIN